jgi:hypothetical protein
MLRRRATRARRVTSTAGGALIGLILAGCSKDSAKPSGGAAASGSAKPLPAPIASGLPGEEQRVSDLVNPNREKAYSGKTGTIRGRVIAKGDPPPDVPAELVKITDSRCESARAEYQKLFRVGPNGGLGDVFVAVTGYRGYVPAKTPSVRVEAKNCFWGTRTIGATVGQNLEIYSKDAQAYVPELLGAPGQPQIVATPGSRLGSVLYPPRIGSYVLIDNLKLFMTADVLVVKYATFDVTNVDGAFEINGIPVGNVTLSAMLPSTGFTVQKRVELKGDAPLDVDLELVFDASEYERRRAAGAANRKSAASPAPSASDSPPPKPPPSASARPGASN